MQWIAVIVAITCDVQRPLLCCSLCEGTPGANPRIEQLTDFKTAERCNRFASEWARGKTLMTGRLWGGFCRGES